VRSVCDKFKVTNSDKLCYLMQQNTAVFHELWLDTGVVNTYIYYIYIR
jgi:hypothetical protein